MYNHIINIYCGKKDFKKDTDDEINKLCETALKPYEKLDADTIIEIFNVSKEDKKYIEKKKYKINVLNYNLDSKKKNLKLILELKIKYPEN